MTCCLPILAISESILRKNTPNNKILDSNHFQELFT
jgi:hypothetical protein